MTTDHQNRVAAWEANDRQHPDHYKFKMAFRDTVLASMDDASDEHSMTKVLDKDLPELFKTLDAIAEKLWLRRLGYVA
jgi:hypothetical protein